MAGRIKNFFLQLQKKEEKSKKHWLIFLASTSMIFVILLWLVYLNFTVENIGEQQTASQGTGQFFSVFQKGIQEIAKIAGETVNNAPKKLQELLKQTNSITIQKTDPNFIVKDLEPIPLKKMP